MRDRTQPERLRPLPATEGWAIVDVLARYAQIIDNRDWDELPSVFTPDIIFGRRPVHGFAGVIEAIESVTPYHPHHTTNTVTGLAEDGTVRAWSKYVIVRDDGTAASGDYLDVLVATAAGWRIRRRYITRGARPADDPGGPSHRDWTFDHWRGRGDAGG